MYYGALSSQYISQSKLMNFCSVFQLATTRNVWGVLDCLNDWPSILTTYNVLEQQNHTVKNATMTFLFFFQGDPQTTSINITWELVKCTSFGSICDLLNQKLWIGEPRDLWVIFLMGIPGGSKASLSFDNHHFSCPLIWKMNFFHYCTVSPT